MEDLSSGPTDVLAVPVLPVMPDMVAPEPTASVTLVTVVAVAAGILVLAVVTGPVDHPAGNTVQCLDNHPIIDTFIVVPVLTVETQNK